MWQTLFEKQITFVATEGMSSVATEEMPSVATEEMSSVQTDEMSSHNRVRQNNYSPESIGFI